MADSTVSRRRMVTVCAVALYSLIEGLSPLAEAMNYPVILHRNSAEEYVAEPLGKPELKTTAATEHDAREQVGKVLREWLGSGRLVEVGIPQAGTVNPWLDAWGSSANTMSS